jgi:hypothetical protein
MNEISIDTIALIVGLLANFAGMSWYFGKLAGSFSTRLTEHEKRHIRHEARLDDHSSVIQGHGESIAALKVKVDIT